MRALTLVAALCALVLAGCGSGTDEEAVAPTTSAAETAPPPPDASGRPPAPAVEGTSLDGEPLSLADYRGRPVFVNVWSSW
ncbi:MAG: hypothetical protein WD015_08810 [Gaiellaceae bacterium]